MVATLLARMLEHFQGIVILEQRNVTHSSTALARVLLEAAFSLVACVNHKDFYYKLTDWDALARKKMAQSLLAVSPQCSMLTDDERGRVADIVEEARSEVKELNQKNKTAGLKGDIDLPIEQIANYAGMSDFYNAIYSVFSSTVHSGIRSLSGQVEIDASSSNYTISCDESSEKRFALL